jgi:hypothetical protein
MALPATNHHLAVRRLNLVRIALLIPVLFLTTWVGAVAQLAGKGQINGTVTDTSGAAIPGAQVVVKSKQTSLSTTATTTSAGDFALPTLDPGDYTVTVTANGFEKLVQENVQVNALETQTLNPKLTVGATSEEVTVSAAPPQLETSNATLGATMEQEVYSALPIEMGAYGQPDQRRATDFAFLMPGVQGNNTNGNPTTNTGVINGSGSRGAAADVYVDGIPFVRGGGNGDPRYVWTAVSVDAVNQMQVQTSGYSAIYEGEGLENYTIKQGGTAFHGSVYEFFRNTALDTWGFFGSVPNPATGQKVKPIEHSNEYGIDLGGPLLPFGSLKQKLFFFGNYSGFRYSSQTPTQITFPTAAQQQGNFGALCSTFNGSGTCTSGIQIYDPYTQTGSGAPNACVPAAGTGTLCRNPYPFNQIPSSELSQVALTMQKYLPSGIGTGLQNNYISPNSTGLTNWSTTDRIDYQISSKDTLTMVGAIGRQASSNPVGQTTAGRNVGPIPYNYGQTYAPKTAVGIIEEVHIFTPHVINQFKYGYARYNGPTYDANQLPQYSATAMGISGQPTGPAQESFPIVTYSGTDAPTNWGGTSPNVTLAENYTLLDNVQWTKGKHSFTFGGQIAWILYNVVSATGGSTAITLADAVTETAGISKNTTISGSGYSYASYLVGQTDKLSFTDYLQQELGTRWRAISPYVQDNWKITEKLTIDAGLRYDYWPSLTEVHNAQSFFNPNLANPVTGVNGALQFAGHGTNTCNCSTPVNNFYKNFGPRLGIAYQVDPKTVVRASYGLMFSHGDAVGGLASSLGTLGFSSAPSFSSSTTTFLSTAPFNGTNGVIPGYALASGVSSGPAFGTGYTTTSGYTGTPSGMGYADPYLGGRAPEYLNWTFGFQHQWTDALTSNITYVGSQGHFLQADGSNARGYWADQLDPKYLYLGTTLNDSGTALKTFCAANTNVCPSTYPIINQTLATLLKPFPFQTVSDTFGYVANSNYNALQATLNMRPTHGLTFMANYTWSHTIDDGGTFRSGYPIPAAYSNTGASWAADRIERDSSTSNQPHHIVVTGVWDMPFGRSVLAGSAWERAIFGGYKLSEIFQAFSGSPLAITGSSCQTNPAESTCNPMLNPSFTGSARVNGKWGQGITAANTSAISYIATSAGNCTSTLPTGPFINPVSTCLNSSYAPSYTFGNAPRTAPYGLYGPGNYNLDLALVRSFPLHFTEAARLELRAEWYNVTNHTWFAVASTAVGNASFGEVTSNASATRKSAQLDARINF